MDRQQGDTQPPPHSWGSFPRNLLDRAGEPREAGRQRALSRGEEARGHRYCQGHLGRKGMRHGVCPAPRDPAAAVPA